MTSATHAARAQSWVRTDRAAARSRPLPAAPWATIQEVNAGRVANLLRLRRVARGEAARDSFPKRRPHRVAAHRHRLPPSTAARTPPGGPVRPATDGRAASALRDRTDP